MSQAFPLVSQKAVIFSLTRGMLTTSSEPWQDNCQRLAVDITIWLCSISSIKVSITERSSWTNSCLSLGAPAPKLRGSRGSAPWETIFSTQVLHDRAYGVRNSPIYQEKTELRTMGCRKQYHKKILLWLYITLRSSELAHARRACIDLRFIQQLEAWLFEKPQ